MLASAEVEVSSAGCESVIFVVFGSEVETEVGGVEVGVRIVGVGGFSFIGAGEDACSAGGREGGATVSGHAASEIGARRSAKVPASMAWASSNQVAESSSAPTVHAAAATGGEIASPSRSPKGEASFECEPLDGFNRRFADAAGGGIDDAQERNRVIGILDDFEIRDHVFDLGAFVEREPAHHVILEPVAAHGLFKQARLRVRAVEDGGAGGFAVIDAPASHSG